ncbi:MAG TPA: hypothetical protein PLW26_02160 [Candidatus Mcinerneyibacteriales bacterium]|nr:hypothetical protein [Candidatus Mcinerneyibacteriales bacterium]
MTSFYKKLEGLSHGSGNETDYAEKVAELLSDEFGVSVTLCEIFSKRWSFLGGAGLSHAGAARREVFDTGSRCFGLLLYPDPGNSFPWDRLKPLLIKGFSSFLA